MLRLKAGLFYHFYPKGMERRGGERAGEGREEEEEEEGQGGHQAA